MKYFLLAAIFIGMAFFLASGHPMTGVEVKPDGDVIEPFYLIPISILFFIIASLLVVIGLVKQKAK